ncbi:MAG TPA: alpha/beta hydrolase [Candidatus Brocadiia bacterium]|nr:alpha/beta hydrolase [Candidatus Brocadiia bacterium]
MSQPDHNQEIIRHREYGGSGPRVVLLHGGPGAPGYMAALANQLQHAFCVLEPFQRGSGAEPLTVARHVADLSDFIASRCADSRPALVGHSWGAMLALAFAAEHPGAVASLALIGCGTFDLAARARMNEIVRERMGEDVPRRLERLRAQCDNPDDALAEMGRLIDPVYSFDAIPDEGEPVRCDAKGHEETWADMLRLQSDGVYPAAFRRIICPVAMLHGAFDPHPGQMIRDGLRSLMPQLEYAEWEKCGHYPWREKAARDGFIAFLTSWLAEHAAGSDSSLRIQPA